MKKYCGHCEGWYVTTGADQCNVVRKKTNPEIKGFTGVDDRVQEETFYGRPSKLNARGDCQYYDEISLDKKIFRKRNYKIPLNLSPPNPQGLLDKIYVFFHRKEFSPREDFR